MRLDIRVAGPKAPGVIKLLVDGEVMQTVNTDQNSSGTVSYIISYHIALAVFSV